MVRMKDDLIIMVIVVSWLKGKVCHVSIDSKSFRGRCDN